MLGLTGFRLGLAAALCVLVASVVGLGYWHYTSLVSDLEEKTKQITRLEGQVAQERSNVQEAVRVNGLWAAEQQRTVETLKRLTAVQEDASSTSRRLEDALARINLGQLAEDAPDDAEARVNRGTERVRSLLEHATRGTKPDNPAPAAGSRSPAASQAR